MPKLTGGQVVAQLLKQYGVPYVAGIPGHGIWSLTDAFLEKGPSWWMISPKSSRRNRGRLAP